MILRVLFFLGLILGLTVYFNLSQEHPISIQEVFNQDRIIKYRMGNIDPRFQLSVEEVQYLAYEATQIWEKGTNQTLFEYDPNARLSINLIYDDRQESSLYVNQMNKNMDIKSKELEELNTRLDHQVKTLKQRQQDMEQQYTQLRSDQMAWRRLEFDDGENLQRLKAVENQLRQKRDQLSNDWDTYHLNVKLYNEKVDTFNQHAAEARQFNQKSPPRLFHKGTFSGDRIDVYQFASKNDLKVTLAHEFGHALGMSHHQDPQALMYPSMAQQDIDHFELRPADILLFQQR